jgi:hypothetical protein
MIVLLRERGFRFLKNSTIPQLTQSVKNTKWNERFLILFYQRPRVERHLLTQDFLSGASNSYQPICLHIIPVEHFFGFFWAFVG